MKRSIILSIYVAFACSFNSTLLLGQTDSVQDSSGSGIVKTKRALKNTIRFNLTNPILFGEKSIIFGYERTLGLQQSISVNLGVTSFPKLINPDLENSEIQLTNDAKEQGINTSIDYRFYLNKVNKYAAPRGVYIGPYFSYNYFERENTWTLNTNSFQGDVITNFRMDIETLGFELGYQFVFWRRVALDFVLFGPGVAGYSLKSTVNTSLSAEDEAELLQIINDHLAEKFPGYTIVIDEREFKKNGTAKSTDLGFRYMIHLGIRF